MSDWKDLEIRNIPEFAENKVDVQRLVDNEWVVCKVNKSSIVYDVVENTVSTKYRYRLKPLETQRISKELYSYLQFRFLQGNTGLEAHYDTEKIFEIDGRKVEIIEE